MGKTSSSIIDSRITNVIKIEKANKQPLDVHPVIANVTDIDIKKTPSIDIEKAFRLCLSELNTKTTNIPPKKRKSATKGKGKEGGKMWGSGKKKAKSGNGGKVSC